MAVPHMLRPAASPYHLTPFMKHRLKSWLPSAEKIRTNRWLSWLGPALHHPRLWHVRRKGVALGLALGVFFGLMLPVAQIPGSAAAAVVLRANLPMAVASTLVTNPVTFGPIYYAAYRLGVAILGKEHADDPEATAALMEIHKEPDASAGWLERLHSWLTTIGSIGKPLFLGLAILATVSSITVYFLVSEIWIWKTRLARRHRTRRRTAASLHPREDQ